MNSYQTTTFICHFVEIRLLRNDFCWPNMITCHRYENMQCKKWTAKLLLSLYSISPFRSLHNSLHSLFVAYFSYVSFVKKVHWLEWKPS